MVMDGKDFLFSPGKENLPEGPDRLGEKENAGSQEDAVDIGYRGQEVADEGEDQTHQGAIEEETQDRGTRRTGRADAQTPDRNVGPAEEKGKEGRLLCRRRHDPAQSFHEQNAEEEVDDVNEVIENFQAAP